MSVCNYCGYKADYIKEDSNDITEMLCGACLDDVEQGKIHIVFKNDEN